MALRQQLPGQRGGHGGAEAGAAHLRVGGDRSQVRHVGPHRLVGGDRDEPTVTVPHAHPAADPHRAGHGAVPRAGGGEQGADLVVGVGQPRDALLAGYGRRRGVGPEPVPVGALADPGAHGVAPRASIVPRGRVTRRTSSSASASGSTSRANPGVPTTVSTGMPRRPSCRTAVPSGRSHRRRTVSGRTCQRRNGSCGTPAPTALSGSPRSGRAAGAAAPAPTSSTPRGGSSRPGRAASARGWRR